MLESCRNIRHNRIHFEVSAIKVFVGTCFFTDKVFHVSKRRNLFRIR